MSTAFPKPYTNEVSPEFLRTLNVSPFTDHQLAEFGQEATLCEGVPKAEDFLLAVEG